MAGRVEVPGPLVETQWLADNQDKVVILDAREDTKSFIRKSKGGGHIGGMQACGAKKGGGGTVSGHIPGSALVPWKDYAVKKKVGGVELYDMVPTKQEFEKLMQQSGVNQDSAVVITHRGEDAKNVGRGTRLYWTLKYFGHDNVSLLDGGVAKWAAEKRKIDYGRTRPKKGNWKATAERGELLATLDDIKRAKQDGVPRCTYYMFRGMLPLQGFMTAIVMFNLFILYSWWSGRGDIPNASGDAGLYWGHILGGPFLAMGAVFMIGCEVRTYARLGLGYATALVALPGFYIGYLPYTLFQDKIDPVIFGEGLTDFITLPEWAAYTLGGTELAWAIGYSLIMIGLLAMSFQAARGFLHRSLREVLGKSTDELIYRPCPKLAAEVEAQAKS